MSLFTKLPVVPLLQQKSEIEKCLVFGNAEILVHGKSYLVACRNILSALEEIQNLFNITCSGCSQEAGVTVRL